MAAHTYWRLYIGAMSNVYAQIGTVSFLNAAQVNQSAGGTATASSVYSGAWPASNAFDGNPASEWASSGSAASEWIAYQHPSPVDIAFVGVKSSASYPVSGLALQYSDDGVSWSPAQPLYVLAGQPALTTGSYTVLGPIAVRRPIVIAEDGQLKELPAGDTLPPQAPAAHSHATSDVTGLDAALAGKEPAISAGTTAQYWLGDKTWRDFFTDVRAATLTGLSTATNAVITAADTVLVALGKLQAQVSTKANAASVREKLTANRTYYVRTDGSDSNDGLANTSGGAFLTVQKAVDVVASIDLSIYDVTIIVGAGTWTAHVTLKTLVGAGKVVIRGANADMTSTVISTTSANCFDGVFVGHYRLQYMRLSTSGSGDCLQPSGAGAVVSWLDVEFSTCAGSHVVAFGGAYAYSAGSYTISGGANYHIGGYDCTHARIVGGTVTLTGTPAFSGAFAIASRNASLVIVNVTFSGSATGKRYAASMNGSILTFSGETFLPGDSAGIKADGGQYA